MHKTFLLFAPTLLLAADPAAEQVAFFEKNVRPVLVSRCYGCHSAETKPAGFLRVDDRNGLLRGGDSGPAVVPGDPDNSLIIKRITHADPKKRMPKEGGLVTEAELANIRAWIKDGAAWPREVIPSFIGRARPSYEKIKATHWSLQPVKETKAPAVRNRAWASSDVDRFILAKLEEKNLPPVGEASRATLIRRVAFDLTGLPPTPAEIAAFEKDPSPKAYADLVDRLLASPRFGERWGRHWLDVARFGESSGPSRNMPYPHAWRYRDYVIGAINRDVPFDRFVQEQIAGDLLPAASASERDRLLIATGFLALGVKDVNQRFKERFQMDNVDEQLDTVSRSVLGLTVTCARCHDHKFDPIPTTDYYGMAGIFTSTVNAAGLRNKMGGAGLDYYDPKLLVRLASEMPPPPADKLKELEAQVAVAKKKWESIRGTAEGLAIGPDGKPRQRPFRLEYERLQGDLLALTDPGARGYAVHGVRDAEKVGDTEVRIRGEAERLGPLAPRGFLTAFTVPGAAPLNPSQSGRLELAQWLTHPANPLTARVAVNRTWQHLFGDGLVTTVDNFGVNGTTPSHPELLDYLSAQFVREGWSVKKLVRTLVLSRAYRLGTEAPAPYREIDPANRLVWRHSPRRLQAEEIRDAMLATSGQLDLSAPNGSAAMNLKMVEMRDDGPEAFGIHQAADQSVKRSVYLPLLRGLTPRSLEAFDPVTQTLVTGQRDATTVPGQALFLLNSSFVRRQSLALAGTLLEEKGWADTGRIRKAYRLILGRAPSEAETGRAQKFIAAYEPAYRPAARAIATKVTAADLPADQDDERGSVIVPQDNVEPPDARTAAWMALVQSLYASAEFRFVR